MKHFIYITEDKVQYIRKEAGKSGEYSFMGSRSLAGGSPVDDALESLSEVYKLKGKKIGLVIGTFVNIYPVELPASLKKTALQMAEKQLLVLGKANERILAADFKKESRPGLLRGVIYTAPEEWIHIVRASMASCGLRMGTILPWPAFVASFPEPESYGIKEESVILVQLTDDLLAMYEIENGHCCRWKKFSLKPGAFMDMGEERALVEEIVVLIRQFQCDIEERGMPVKARGLIISSECEKAPASFTEMLRRALKVPWICLEKGELWKKQAKAAELKNLQFYDDNIFMGTGTICEKLAEAGYPVIPVAVSLVLFAMIAGVFFTGQLYVDKRLRRLDQIQEDRRSLQDEEGQKLLEKEMETIKSLKRERRELIGTEMMDTVLFSSLDHAMSPGMELEALIYEADEGNIRIRLKTEEAGQIPQFCEKMEEAGFELLQSHWQQGNGITASIVLGPGKGDADETQ